MRPHIGAGRVRVSGGCNKRTLHTAQSSVDALLNSPAGQAVHVVAASPASVLVTDPAGQTAHAVVDVGLCSPAAQAVHLDAPLLLSVLVV